MHLCVCIAIIIKAKEATNLRRRVGYRRRIGGRKGNSGIM